MEALNEAVEKQEKELVATKSMLGVKQQGLLDLQKEMSARTDELREQEAIAEVREERVAKLEQEVKG